MLSFSASPTFSGSFPGATVLSSAIASTRFAVAAGSFSVQLKGRRCCPCTAYPLKVRAIAELAECKELTERASSLKRMAVVASESGEGKEVRHSRTFLNARSEEELLSGIRKELEAGRLTPSVAARMEEVYQNYQNAVQQSGNPRASEIILSNMAVAFDRILLEVEEPFSFSSHHKAIREPFDYYMFGQNYIQPLIDFRKSYIGNVPLFYDIEEKLQKGHNIILISNHQTEADPAVISLLLQTTNPHFAEKLIYIAGDRVVTDPVCKPFSMGRNLLCVFSKKHMNDNPELVEMKKRANTRSLKEMALLLRAGAQVIWIAPSGGRDRPDPLTRELYPAPFDSSSVDNMRRISDHSGVPGHIYPLALLCYDIMPPPAQVEKQVGERRMIAYHGVGLSVAPEMSFNEIAGDIENPEEAKLVFSQALYDSVSEQYKVLKSAIYGNHGLKASNAIISLSQPWQPSTE